MKKNSCSLIFVLSVFLISGCNGNVNKKKDTQAVNDSIVVPDTGYTGIKQFMSGRNIVSEVTFKNGVKQGLMKSFYAGGKVRQTLWYKDGVRTDTAIWYYEEGQVFRKTPYKNDTVDGEQIQYFREGRVKARLRYIKGLRTPFLMEYSKNGTLIDSYPNLIVNINDEYKTKGVYSISLQLSDKSEKVRFYIGEFGNGVFDTTKCKKVNTIGGTGKIVLKKTGSKKVTYIGVIAEILTGYGNNHLIYKKIDLPYDDLK